MTIDTKKKADFEEYRKRARRFPDATKIKDNARKDSNRFSNSRAARFAELKQIGNYNQNTMERREDVINLGWFGVKGYGKRKLPDPNIVKVYLVRFRSKRNPFYSFIKIGISNSGTRIRFFEDLGRYDILQLGAIKSIQRNKALEIEKRLHQMFADMQHIPNPTLLCGGNTECFVNDEQMITKVLEIFSLFTKELKRIKRLNSLVTGHSPRKEVAEV